MPIHCKVTPQHFIMFPWQFSSTNLHSWVEGLRLCESEVFCQRTQHNDLAKSQNLYTVYSIQAWIFFFQVFFYTGYLSSVNYCKDHSHIHFFVCCSHIWFSCIHSHLLYLWNTCSSLHVLKISPLSQEFCHSFQLQINWPLEQGIQEYHRKSLWLIHMWCPLYRDQSQWV